MIQHKTIKIGKLKFDSITVRLGAKNFVLLCGAHGYVMCGYLNLAIAGKLGDIGIKVTGVSSIEDLLKSRVAGCTPRAKRLGISPGQPVRFILKYIA